MSTEASLNRRRVARACDSCRSLKAKCDGHQPVCRRCAGYGYTCRWGEGARRRRSALRVRQAQLELLPIDDEVQPLRDALAGYDDLIRALWPNLSESDRKVLDLGLASIQIPGYAARQTGEGAMTESPLTATPGDHRLPSPSPSRRFLGEASDIRFFHTMESAICQQTELDQQMAGVSETRVDSYEQDVSCPLGLSELNAGRLPQRSTADNYMDIYFSTIHIAYPFLLEPHFRKQYEAFWQSGSMENFREPWLSLLLTIFAIGSCYETVSEYEARNSSSSRVSDQHQRYFDRAVTMTQKHASKHSVEHVCSLLAQCFYLLATCQTDRCWTTLGMTVRVAQSIGLHVEEGHRPAFEDTSSPPEIYRRVWYSIFVLDRLVALQLGRPSAISDHGFDVKLPSRESSLDLSDTKGVQDLDQQTEWVGDYFLAMIKFSRTIGRVFDGLYGPGKAVGTASLLSEIDRLGDELLQWKSELPRKLRFDLSHTFERSVVFKRQRNMLAIKFYNLQALIHRPLLSLAGLLASQPDPAAFYQTENIRTSSSKTKCILAAQQTAKLLHNIEDKQSLVYGFPWWQMISCLICASSILLVASICVDPTLDRDVFRCTDWEAVDEDAEVCLKVFQALSLNSNAARLARDMMQRLKKTRKISQGNVPDPPESRTTIQRIEKRFDHLKQNLPSSDPFQVPMSLGLDPFGANQESFNLMFQTMPYEVSEPVMWSAQFVNAAYNPFLSRADIDEELASP